MVDEVPGPYRPRRAYSSEPDPAGEAASPAPPTSAGGPTDPGAEVETGNLDPYDDERQKPLYRDEVYGANEPTIAFAGAHPTEPNDETRIRPGAEESAQLRAKSDQQSDPESDPESDIERTSEQTQILSRARARARSGQAPPSRRRPREDDQTTILPRTAAGGRVRRNADEDLLDDDAGPKRSRTALLIGAVAAVVVLGLAVGYTVLSLTRSAAAPGVAPTVPSGSVAPTGPSGSPNDPDPSALLTDAMLLTPQIATKIADDRTWKVQLTQKGRSADSAQPACLGGDPVEGQPIPQQSMLRVLNSTGKNPPAVLQQADAYASPEEAAQAYAIAARSLGGCTMAATSIDSGAVVSGLGDQTTAVTLRVANGSTAEFRTVVLTRTGRVLDIIDVAQAGQAVEVDRVALASADVVNTQCRAAGGKCAAGVRVTAGPPPVGGDVLGFLAPADLPPVGPNATTWVANKPQAPKAGDVRGSSCERVDWAKEPAEERAWRTYLLQDLTGKFGLDEVVLTLKSPADATKLAEKIQGDWSSCEQRVLTAAVAKPKKFDAVGARNSAVSGWTTTVKQTQADATTTFRVGVAAAGAKLVFVFLTPDRNLDLSEAQFEAVTARAGQRATQVK